MLTMYDLNIGDYVRPRALPLHGEVFEVVARSFCTRRLSCVEFAILDLCFGDRRLILSFAISIKFVFLLGVDYVCCSLYLCRFFLY